MKKKNGGFTLVELLVTMACSTLIMFAAMTFLLVCMRLDVSAQTTASQQGTARIVLSLLEDVTGTGQVERVETVGDDWMLFGQSGGILLQYSASNNAFLTGGGAVLMDGIQGSDVSLDGSKLLTVSFQTNEDRYETSVYCRTSVEAATYGGENGSWVDEARDEQDPSLEETYDGRYALLEILAAQYGSEGEIKGAEGGPRYFSEWYIGTVVNRIFNLKFLQLCHKALHVTFHFVAFLHLLHGCLLGLKVPQSDGANPESQQREEHNHNEDVNQHISARILFHPDSPPVPDAPADAGRI